jgi:hypothetical protein
MANKYGQRSTAFTVRYLGRQRPTPAPHVESSSFHLSPLDHHLKQGIEFACESEYCDPRDQRRKQDHVVPISKATMTPTGKPPSCLYVDRSISQVQPNNTLESDLSHIKEHITDCGF